MKKGQSSTYFVANPVAIEINLKECYGIEKVSSFIESDLLPLIAQASAHFQLEASTFLEQPIKWPCEFGKCLKANFKETLDYYNYYLKTIALIHEKFVLLDNVEKFIEQKPEETALSESQLLRFQNGKQYLMEIYFFSITRLYLYTIEILRQKPDFELNSVFFNEVMSFELPGEERKTPEQIAGARIAIIFSILRKINFAQFTLHKDIISLLHSSSELDKARSVSLLMTHFSTLETLLTVQFQDHDIVSPSIADSELYSSLGLLVPVSYSSKTKEKKLRVNTDNLEFIIDALPNSTVKLYLICLNITAKFKYFTYNANSISDKHSEAFSLLEKNVDFLLAHQAFMNISPNFSEFNSTKYFAQFIIMSHIHLIKSCCIAALIQNTTHDVLKRFELKKGYFEKARNLVNSLLEFDKYLMHSHSNFTINAYITFAVKELTKSTKVAYIKISYKKIELNKSSITEDLNNMKDEILFELEKVEKQIKEILDQRRAQEEKNKASVMIREKNHEAFYQEVLKESKEHRSLMIRKWEEAEKIKAEKERIRNKKNLALKKLREKANSTDETLASQTPEMVDPVREKFKRACILLNSNKLEEAFFLYSEILNSPTCTLQNTIEALMYMSDYHQKIAKNKARLNLFKEAAQHFYGALFNATTAVKLIQKNSDQIPIQIISAAHDRLVCNRNDLTAFENYTQQILTNAKLEREELIRSNPDKWKKGNSQKPSQKTVAFRSLIVSSFLLQKANKKYEETQQMLEHNQSKDELNQNEQQDNIPVRELITRFMVIVKDSNGKVIKDNLRKHALDDLVLLNPSYLKPFLKSELCDELNHYRFKKYILNELSRESFRAIFCQPNFIYDESNELLQPALDR